MITKLRVIESVRENDNLENIFFIKVNFELLNEADEVVDTRSLRFPLETSEEEITAELNKYLATQISEESSKIENAEADAVMAQADETVEALQNKEIVAESGETSEEGGE